ncbi:MAG TPA: RES family NAD+ phosphorylase [Chthoniobacteraceae bacterium]
MLRSWRIVREARETDAFTGEGARQFGGRWNSAGRAMVYTSEHSSLAALEILVHLTPRPDWRFKVFRVQFGEDLVEHIGLEVLAGDWRISPPPASTREIGDRWIREQRSAVLAVPSAIVPVETSYLLNPAHPDFFRIRIDPSQDFAFDPRLLGVA